MSITWNGISSDDLGIVIQNVPEQNHPELKLDVVSIPGRNGDMIVSQNAWHNYEQQYDIFAGEADGEAPQKYFDIIAWLTSAKGYARLEDSFDPDHYRMAYFAGPLDVAFTLTRVGRATITFNCKPQRFLEDGSEYVTYYPVSNGGFNASGVSIDDAYTYRVEYMPVTPGTTFKASASYADTSIHSEVLTVAFYTSSKAGISTTPSASGTDQSVEVTVPSNAAYARVMYGAFMSTTKFTLTIENNGVTTTYSDGGPLLINPTGYVAQPIISAQDAKLIQVQRLGIGNDISGDVTTVTVSDYSGTGRTDCVIDSVIGDAYSEEIWGMSAAIVNLNPYVTITENGVLSDYPTLGAGANIINTATNDDGRAATDCFTSCKIKAGWWHI